MKDQSELIAREIARALLDIKAITITSGKPFVWSSGMKAPVYCDNRRTLSYPKIRSMLIDGFVEKASKHEFDYVAGVATAGIAHAAWVAERLSLPLVYVRPEPKGHGHQNQIEGHLSGNSKVLMIEDLVATGLSSIQAAEAIQDVTGSMPVITLAIFTYKLDGVAELFQKKSTPLETLSDFDVLLDVAIETGYISSEWRDSLLEWRDNYQEWTLKH